MANVRKTASTKKNNISELMEKTPELRPFDLVKVKALIPNVYYTNSKTGNSYVWQESEQVEEMTFEDFTDIWRNHRGYITELVLRPLDDVVIKRYGLTGFYSEYDFVLNGKNYTLDNLSKIYNVIDKSNNAVKINIIDKIKLMINNGDITNIRVVKNIEQKYDITLVQ